MFCTKCSINKINSIHERCLRLIQQNYISDFEVLLENANEKPIHQKCKELFMIEWLRFINAWMVYLLISWVTSLNSMKIPTIWEIFIYLNLRISKQNSLAYTSLHIDLVNCGKIFLKEFEIKPHFLSLRRKQRRSPWSHVHVIVAENTSTKWDLSSCFYIFNWINLSTSCSPEFRINLALYI